MKLPERMASRVAALQMAARLRLDRIDAMPERQKGGLAALAVVALVTAEFGWVLPIREQRDRVVAASVAEQQAAEEGERQRREHLASEQAAVEFRLAAAETELVRRGAASSRSEPLGKWLQQALTGQPVRVLALRDLGVTEIDTAALVAPAQANSATTEPEAATRALTAAAAQAGTDPAHATDGAEQTARAHSHPTLYRHRFELTLTGSVDQLIASTGTLAERMAPLRVERVRLHSRDGVAVELTLGFVIVTAERAWIAL
ncbi:MAG: hypothetical protein JNL30_13965 [Rubrivivax sp.]|nr:hypothetical protein [Rubrivivax sp.]